MQVGNDQQTSTNYKSKLWFGLDKKLSTLVLNFNFIFSNQQRLGWADGILIPNLHKAFFVSGNPMTTQYYKRHFDETRTEQSEEWGTCDYYFETNLNGEVLRQIEVYANGKILRYSEQFIEDKFGFVADQPLDLSDFENFAITKTDFELQWQK